MALIRLVLMGGVVLTVVYVCLSLYSRAARREKLRQAWEAGDRNGDWKTNEDDADGLYSDWDSYRDAGMDRYDRSLRKKLILGVYVVPVVAVVTVIYITNYT